jgi:hypothetical protein
MKRLGCLTALGALLLAGCGSSAHRGAGTNFGGPNVHFVRGGIRTLAEGRVSRGPAFAIKAERYRFEGKLTTDLAVQMEPHAKHGGGAGGSFSPRSREPFEWTTQEGCSTTVRWSIVFGLLQSRSDHGVLFLGSRRYRLRAAPIPTSFHLLGQLGFAALSRAPTRVLIRDGAGKIIQDEDLGAAPREHCTPGESSGLFGIRR